EPEGVRQGAGALEQRVLTRAAVARYLDALNGGDPDAIAACVTEDFYNEHTSALGHSRRGRAAYREEFTGVHCGVEDSVVEGDRAAVAGTMTGVCHGDPVSVRGVCRFRVED